MKRILIKLSGEILCPGSSFQVLHNIRADIKNLIDHGIEVAIVVGGGNIIRGRDAEKLCLHRMVCDHAGMLCTIINALLLQSFFQEMIPTSVLSSKEITGIVKGFYADDAIKLLKAKNVLVLAGGTGNILFTTDTAAAIRAYEINAEVIFKMSNVDGIYTKDPNKHKGENIPIFSALSFQEVLDKGLDIMDREAFSICQKHDIPICVMHMDIPNILSRIILEKSLEGTWVTNGEIYLKYQYTDVKNYRGFSTEIVPH